MQSRIPKGYIFFCVKCESLSQCNFWFCDTIKVGFAASSHFGLATHADLEHHDLRACRGMVFDRLHVCHVRIRFGVRRKHATLQRNDEPIIVWFECLETPATVDASILLVETNPDALTTLDELFFDLGCFVDVFSTGQEALEFLRQNTPTIAILSADLTNPSGVDVCFRVKRIRRLQHMPVLIISNNEDDKTRDFAQMAKADVFLPKPLEPELLRAVIEELLARAQAQADLKNTGETVILDFNS